MPTTRGRAWGLAAGGVLALLAFALRVRCFQWYATDWDAAEYVWAARDGYLPHSPYVLHLWLGRLLSFAFAPAPALSAASLVAGLAAVVLLFLLVRERAGVPAASVAATGLAVVPVCVWQSSFQEVYALQLALVLAAFWAAASPTPRRLALGGVLFGAALATHTSTVFLGPALLLQAWTGRVSAPAASEPDRTGLVQPVPTVTERARRFVPLALGGALLPVLAWGWLLWIFATTNNGNGVTWLMYLRGIAPAPRGFPGAGAFVAQALELSSSALSTMFGALPAVPLVGLLAAGALLAWKARGELLFWLVFALPYVGFEWLLGQNMDEGLYSVFVAPAAVAVAGTAAGLAVAAWREGVEAKATRAVTAVLAATGVLLLYVPAAARSIVRAETVVPRARIEQSELMRTCRWLAANHRPGAVIVQPPSVRNVNLLPLYSGLRPITTFDRRYFLFDDRRWAPLRGESFPALNCGDLERLRDAGTEVYSLVRDPFGGNPPCPPARVAWDEQSIGDGAGGWHGKVYRLSLR